MLKQRILTAIILAALVFSVIFWAPPSGMLLASSFVMLLAAWEWSRLAGFKRNVTRGFYLVAIFILMLAAILIPMFWVLAASAVVWIVAGLWLAIFHKHHLSKVSKSLLGLIMLPSCLVALNFLCFYGARPYWLLWLFAVVWGSDTAAYFVGTRWGKHKLAPSISPNKSIEGTLGALASAVVIGLVVSWLWEGTLINCLVSVVLSVVASAVAIVGDLFESLLKRQQHLKDSGNLLPGHGGILDRIDSLIAAAPIFALGILWFGLGG